MYLQMQDAIDGKVLRLARKKLGSCVISVEKSVCEFTGYCRGQSIDDTLKVLKIIEDIISRGFIGDKDFDLVKYSDVEALPPNICKSICSDIIDNIINKSTD